jgi:hypothetical protein
MLFNVSTLIFSLHSVSLRGIKEEHFAFLRGKKKERGEKMSELTLFKENWQG